MEYKVYADTECVASFVYAEDAAAFVAFRGEGSVVVHRGVVVWREGKERQSAADSYDDAAETMMTRAGRV